MKVTAGRNELSYFGTFTNDEPIHAGTLDLSAVLTQGGQTTGTADIQVKAFWPSAYLQYVLPKRHPVPEGRQPGC